MVEKLKPCPFCGGEPEAFCPDDDEQPVFIMCQSCAGQVPASRNTRAEDAWNRRAPSPDGEAGWREAERERLAQVLEAEALKVPLTDEQMTERVTYAIAASIVRRGRALTDREKLQKLMRGLQEHDEEAAPPSPIQTGERRED